MLPFSEILLVLRYAFYDAISITGFPYLSLFLFPKPFKRGGFDGAKVLTAEADAPSSVFLCVLEASVALKKQIFAWQRFASCISILPFSPLF